MLETNKDKYPQWYINKIKNEGKQKGPNIDQWEKGSRTGSKHKEQHSNNATTKLKQNDFGDELKTKNMWEQARMVDIAPCLQNTLY